MNETDEKPRLKKFKPFRLYDSCDELLWIARWFVLHGLPDPEEIAERSFHNELACEMKAWKLLDAALLNGRITQDEYDFITDLLVNRPDEPITITQQEADAFIASHGPYKVYHIRGTL